MKTLRFIKLSDRWFIDIPWIGDINDLQMVDGAAELLDEWSNGEIVTHLTIATSKTKGLNRIPVITLEKSDEDNFGANYIVYSEFSTKLIWLCPVTKEVFDDEYPNEIYIY